MSKIKRKPCSACFKMSCNDAHLELEDDDYVVIPPLSFKVMMMMQKLRMTKFKVMKLWKMTLQNELSKPDVVEGSGDDVEVDSHCDQRDGVKGGVVKEDVEFEDVIVNLDVDVLVDRSDHEDDHLKDEEWN